MRKVIILIFVFLLCFILFSCEEETKTAPVETEVLISTNETHNLTYQQKLSTFITTDYVSNEEFYNYIVNDNEYIDTCDVLENAIFVSSEGDGEGIVDDPCSIYDAIKKVEPGQTIYLRGGSYNLDKTVKIDKSGLKDKYITIRNYPGEKVYITSDESNVKKYQEYAVFSLADEVSYIKIEGLEIADISTKNVLGIVFWGGGQNNIVIRNNKIHDLKTSVEDIYDHDAGANAILLLGEESEPINNVLIYGNECYNNATGWCETISVSSNCKNVYVIGNYVHNNTNIGIDFYGNAGYCDDPSLDQPRDCVAALNRIESSICDYADAAGLYVDGARDILLTHNYIKSSQYGIEIGAEELSEGYPVKNIVVCNNVVYRNSVCGLRIGGYDAKECGYVTSTKIYNNTIINSGVGTAIIISKVDGIEFINNLVYSEINTLLVAGDMSQTYSKNITFKNNYFNFRPKTELVFYLYKSTQKGFEIV